MATRQARGVLRKKVVPVVAVTLVLLVIALNSMAGVAHGGDESFAFKVFFPKPVEYVPGNPLPDAYLQINYTGAGARVYTYTVSESSTVLARGVVTVTDESPFTVYVVSPAPAVLHATVFEQGSEVYSGALGLG